MEALKKKNCNLIRVGPDVLCVCETDLKFEITKLKLLSEIERQTAAEN
jgi:hypothetical protein